MQFISENTLFAVKCLVYDVVQGNHLKNIEIIHKMSLKFPIFSLCMYKFAAWSNC